MQKTIGTGKVKLGKPPEWSIGKRYAYSVEYVLWHECRGKLNWKILENYNPVCPICKHSPPKKLVFQIKLLNIGRGY